MKVYQEYLYKIVKDFYPEIIGMANFFIDRNKNYYDNQVAIEGPTGEGKSMFTLILMMVISHKLNRSFDLIKQVMYIPTDNEFKNSIRKLDEGECYWVDEAIRALDKHFWYKLDQIEINQLVKTDTRKMQLSIFYNIQRFRELTESFRNHNIQTRIYLAKRKYAIMYIRDDDKDIEDPWHTKENVWLKSHDNGNYVYTVAKDREDILKNEKKCIGYFKHSEFPNLAEIPDLKDLWEYYNELRDQSRQRALEKSEQEKDKPKTKWDKKVNEAIKGMARKAHSEGINATNWALANASWMGYHEGRLRQIYAEAIEVKQA